MVLYIYIYNNTHVWERECSFHDVGIFIVNILDPRRDNVVTRGGPECSRIKSVITNSSVLCVALQQVFNKLFNYRSILESKSYASCRLLQDHRTTIVC